MTGKVLHVEDEISPDAEALRITETWVDWDSRRQTVKSEWEEVARYIFARDTTHTSNAQLPWKNKTTVPKICQIRDNLHANYMSTEFPQTKNVSWMAIEKDAASKRKRDSIQNWMQWVLDQPQSRHELEKTMLDFIDYGNCFATVEWLDQRVQTEDGRIQSGYVGPGFRRISPLDIVMNPTAEDFYSSPKIIRSVISLGELKEHLMRMSNDENREEYEKLWAYLTDIRRKAREYSGDWVQRDALYTVAGFTNFQDYLQSDRVEILTFYGDLYNTETDTFYKNHVITVVDRHKLIGKKPNPSFFGYPPIFHVSWRQNQDNLWGMGPLANIIGMQYRIDHIENMKADIFDLVTYPVQKVKGFVEEYTWQPGEKIFVDEEGDVELLTPDVNVLQSNVEIQNYMDIMEITVGAPREAMGFRTPGEKTKYEFSRLENAAARVFNAKTKRWEELFYEPLLNAALELSRRNMVGVNTIRVFDDELKAATFQTLTVEDLLGAGRIKPVAARHFAEQAEVVQNINSLSQSPIWPYIQTHFSSIALAKFYENMFNLQDTGIVLPFVMLDEQAEGQKLQQAHQEGVLNATMTASGMGDDFDLAPSMAQMTQGPMQ